MNHMMRRMQKKVSLRCLSSPPHLEDCLQGHQDLEPVSWFTSNPKMDRIVELLCGQCILKEQHNPLPDIHNRFFLYLHMLHKACLSLNALGLRMYTPAADRAQKKKNK